MKAAPPPACFGARGGHQLNMPGPLTKLGTNSLGGFEALVRWQHPSGDTLNPISFLPITEETGLMLQVSDPVLHWARRLPPAAR